MEIYGIFSFPISKILQMCHFPKLNNSRHLMIFEILKFRNLLEFSKLKILGVPQIRNFWNFQNCRCSELSKLEVFRIFQNANFWNLSNWKFLEFSKLEIFGIYQIEIF